MLLISSQNSQEGLVPVTQSVTSLMTPPSLAALLGLPATPLRVLPAEAPPPTLTAGTRVTGSGSALGKLNTVPKGEQSR